MIEPTIDDLADARAHDHLARLRAHAPVAWVSAIAGWMVTARAEALAVLRDAQTFTVDDERFSTAQVVGVSMLSTDGAAHAHHRTPFVPPFSAGALEAQVTYVDRLARSLVDRLGAGERHELRSELAGPLAVEVIAEALGLVDVDPADLLRWYRGIVDGVDRISRGVAVHPDTEIGLSQLRTVIDDAAAQAGSMIART